MMRRRSGHTWRCMRHQRLDARSGARAHPEEWVRCYKRNRSFGKLEISRVIINSLHVPNGADTIAKSPILRSMVRPVPS